MKKSNRFLSLSLVVVLAASLVFPNIAFAKGGFGGGGMGGGARSIGGGARIGGGSSRIGGGTSAPKGVGGGGMGGGTKSVSAPSVSKSYGGSTYSNVGGKTVYAGKTASGQSYKLSVPQTSYIGSYYQSPAYRTLPGGYVQRYYYYDTSPNIWFWMWLMGQNHYGTGAASYATNVKASEVGTTAVAAVGNKKVVPIDEGNEWSKYSGWAKFWVFMTWLLIILVPVAIVAGWVLWMRKRNASTSYRY